MVAPTVPPYVCLPRLSCTTSMLFMFLCGHHGMYTTYMCMTCARTHTRTHTPVLQLVFMVAKPAFVPAHACTQTLRTRSRAMPAERDTHTHTLTHFHALQMAFVVAMPVFVQTPNASDSFGAPTSNGTCSLPVCYNTTTQAGGARACMCVCVCVCVYAHICVYACMSVCVGIEGSVMASHTLPHVCHASQISTCA